MAKIRQSNLDNSIVTGLTELSEGRADGDFVIIYDSSTGSLKKIQASNLGIIAPVVSSVSPTNVLTGDGTGNATFTITGSNFAVGSTAVLVTDGGSEVSFDTLTRDSNTQLTGVIAISSLSNANEPYDVKVTSSGLSNTLANQININAQPVFNTASGSLGTVLNGLRGSTTLEVVAYDPESAAGVTFEIQSGSLPAGATTTTINENGVSKFQISGFSAVGGNTTSNFVVRAADSASNTSSRAFSITVNAPVVESFTSSGTFSVPSGVTAVEVLVVAGGGGGGRQTGGGGGAGGLIFIPNFTVTPGGTVTVTVGGGGAGGTNNNGGTPGKGQDGADSVFGTLTAKGGGGGANPSGGGIANSGGSGGGGSGNGSNPPTGQQGPGTQPTQPGQSGAYGFGNPGGRGDLRSAIFGGTTDSSGGGGGAGGSGVTGHNGADPAPTSSPGNGGIGKAYTIADGTTPVYYAGGGGGGREPNTGWPGSPGTNPVDANKSAQGGLGGGGRGQLGQNGAQQNAQDGTANRGGGGGGGANWCQSASPNPNAAGAGGKGIVIVRY